LELVMPTARSVPTAPRRARHRSTPRGSLVDAAYDALRQRILDNTYPPGHQALEQALGRARHQPHAAAQGADPPAEGGARRGDPAQDARAAGVAGRHEGDLRILSALESMAAALAARRPADAELAPLEQASRDMAALKADDLEAWAGTSASIVTSSGSGNGCSSRRC
jgi:hypothetical protein